MKYIKKLCRQNAVCFSNNKYITCNNQCVLTGFKVTAKIKADIVMAAWAKPVISLSIPTECNILMCAIRFCLEEFFFLPVPFFLAAPTVVQITPSAKYHLFSVFLYSESVHDMLIATH